MIKNKLSAVLIAIRGHSIEISIFVFALITRLIYFAKFMNRGIIFTKYPDLASNLIKEKWIGSHVFGDNPLYIYFYALMSSLFGAHSFVAVWLVQFTLGAFSCLLTYFIAQRLFNRKVGIVAAIIQACYGTIIIYDGAFLPPVLIIFCNATNVLFLLRFFDRQRIRDLFIAGIFLGLSAGANPNIILFAVLCVFWIIIHNKNGSFKNSLLYALFFFCVVVLPLLPIGIRNYIVGKDIVPVTASGGIVFYSGNNQEASGLLFAPPKEILPILDKELSGELRITDITVEHEAYRDIANAAAGKGLKPNEISRYWFKKGIDFIRLNPLQYLKLELKKLFFSVNTYEAADTSDVYTNYLSLSRFPFVTLGIVFPLCVLGIMLSLGQWRRLMLVYLIVGVYFLNQLIFFVTSRYRVPVIPFLIIFCAYAVTRGYALFKEKQYRILSLFAVLFFVLAYASSYEDSIIKDVKKHQLAYHVYFNQGVNAYMKGNHEKSRALFQKAAELDPSLSDRIGRFLRQP